VSFESKIHHYNGIYTFKSRERGEADRDGKALFIRVQMFVEFKYIRNRFTAKYNTFIKT